MRLSHRPVDHRVLHGALSRLEPGAGKLARRVLRGPGDGDVTRLPDYAPSLRSPWRAAYELSIYSGVEQVGVPWADSSETKVFGVEVIDNEKMASVTFPVGRGVSSSRPF